MISSTDDDSGHNETPMRTPGNRSQILSDPARRSITSRRLFNHRQGKLICRGFHHTTNLGARADIPSDRRPGGARPYMEYQYADSLRPHHRGCSTGDLGTWDFNYWARIIIGQLLGKKKYWAISSVNCWASIVAVCSKNPE